MTLPYYSTPDGKVTLYAGHVIDVLREMPAESVNCVVTSPPYWSLRKYDCEPVIWGGESGCEHEWETGLISGEGNSGSRRWQHGSTSGVEHLQRELRASGELAPLNVSHATCHLCGAWYGDLGLEPTPELYVEHTLMWMREVKRVLRKDGTLWLNIGDGYAGGSVIRGDGQWPKQHDSTLPRTAYGRVGALKPKDAVLMPFRVALAAQADGWWVRSVIIWAKPNPMPESVRDRPTDAHEYVFLLTKSKTYFYDAEAVKEAGSPNTHRRAPVGQVSRPPSESPEGIAERGRLGVFTDGRQYDYEPGDSRNLRSVWSFPTQGFPDAHFAVFPRELPERCIKAGCPEWVCPKCGKARVRVTENTPMKIRRTDWGELAGNRTATSGTMVAPAESTTTGWTDCGCGEPFVGGVTLDPFAGSGTTCEVAYHLGRTAIGIDASAKYLDMAIGRVKQGALL